MLDEEKVLALENVIFEFAKGQLEANGISPILARLIMEGVYNKFQGFCLDAFIMSRIETSPPQERVKTVEHTGSGTPEDLMEELKKIYGEDMGAEGGKDG